MKIDQEYELVPVGGDHDILKEHPRNPNKGDEDGISESIDVNGWYGAVTAQRSTGYVLAGNHRFRQALKKGADVVPTIWRDVDDETAIRILLADNRIARKGVLDEELVTELLESLETLDGTGYGLSAAEDAIIAEEAPEEASEGNEALPGADDVPDDVYTPTYGVMLVCGSEEQQAALYEAIQGIQQGADAKGDHTWGGVQMRVVAV